MKFELGDFNFNEQAELMNILKSYEATTQVQKNGIVGFNEDTLYDFIERKQQ
ncbi:MAG: hypothetical protein HFJ48_04465 [Clostridia bacterium]|nr:hypothetical protein [Clostridia bacterium]